MGSLGTKLLQGLCRAFPQPLSGESFAREAEVSRVAVWKEVELLRRRGFPIQSSRMGYALRELPDFLFGDYLEALLEGVFPNLQVFFFEELPSTSTAAKELAQRGYPEGTMVVAEKQTAGRGRLKRQWFSESGKSLTFSLVLRPSIVPESCPALGLLVALVLSLALEKLGFTPRLKWPNDVYLGGRKVAGVLLESSLEMDRVEWVVVGVGVNVNEEAFPPEIQARATSLFLQGGRTLPRWQVLQAFLGVLAEEYPRFVQEGSFAPWLSAYAARFFLLGQVVEVVYGEKRFQGTVVAVDEHGALWLEKEGRRVSFRFGELSLPPLVNL